MSGIYPDIELTEDWIKFTDSDGDKLVLPNMWMDRVEIGHQLGYHHRVTLTMFVGSIHIESGAEFRAVPYED